MNIFILDKDPVVAAQMQCNKHVVKMSLESVQLLCNVHVVDTPYKKTHLKHPCTLWVKESLSNYKWLLEHARALCREYTFRYNKFHKSANHLAWLTYNLPNIKDIGLTDFAQAMPEVYKNKDPVVAYRNYYLGEKSHILAYKERKAPDWIVNNES